MRAGDRVKLLKPCRWAGRPHDDIPVGASGELYEFEPYSHRPQVKLMAIRFNRYKAQGNFHFGCWSFTEGIDIETKAARL